jgi:hypothetical protein
VTVNGTLISQNAGNYDDSDVPPPDGAADGRLFTMGGFNDPFSVLLPDYTDDHERYNLAPYVTKGGNTVTVETDNLTTNNDNLFVAIFASAGTGNVVTAIPEPATWVLLGGGLLLLGRNLRSR